MLSKLNGAPSSMLLAKAAPKASPCRISSACSWVAMPALSSVTRKPPASLRKPLVASPTTASSFWSAVSSAASSASCRSCASACPAGDRSVSALPWPLNFSTPSGVSTSFAAASCVSFMPRSRGIRLPSAATRGLASMAALPGPASVAVTAPFALPAAAPP